MLKYDLPRVGAMRAYEVQDTDTDYEGIVEVGGPGTLERSLEVAAFGGYVHLIGVLAGQAGQVDPSAILHKGLDVEGVTGVGSRAMFDRMLDTMAVAELQPVIDRVFDFEGAREAYRYVDTGKHQGKVVISVA